MGLEKAHCQHACRNTCALLAEALKDEMNIVRHFETMLAECDEPGMRKFVKEMMESHSLMANRISEKLKEIKARAEVLDGVISSFDT